MTASDFYLPLPYAEIESERERVRIYL